MVTKNQIRLSWQFCYTLFFLLYVLGWNTVYPSTRYQLIPYLLYGILLSHVFFFLFSHVVQLCTTRKKIVISSLLHGKISPNRNLVNVLLGELSLIDHYFMDDTKSTNRSQRLQPLSLVEMSTRITWLSSVYCREWPHSVFLLSCVRQN